MAHTEPASPAHGLERPGAPHKHTDGGGRTAAALQVAFLVFAVSLAVLHPDRAQFHTLAITFVSIVLEAFPFMLLGTLISGFIEVFVPRERMARLLPGRRKVTILLAAGLGVVFPVCECAIVPVVRRLLRKGVPVGAAVAYLLGGPIVNPLVAGSTAVAYNLAWPIVATRLLCGYAIAVGVGLLMEALFPGERGLLPGVSLERNEHAACGAPDRGEPPTLRRKLGLAIHHAADDFFDVGRFLVMGAFFAGLMQTLVARRAFASVVGAPVLSILLMMVLAVVLNLCSESDAFVAASFRSSPVPLSAQMAFMVLGPMLDVKLILMYLRVFRKRMIVALSCTTFAAVLVAMLLFEWIR